jgi:hypothetical protein
MIIQADQTNRTPEGLEIGKYDILETCTLSASSISLRRIVLPTGTKAVVSVGSHHVKRFIGVLGQ